MAKIQLNNVDIDFPVYGANTRSIKSQLMQLGKKSRFNSEQHQVLSVKSLQDVSLQFNDGDRVGLIGSNGAGKSTLLRLIAEIYEPTRGSLTVEGKVSAILDIMLGLDEESSGYENITLRGVLHGLSYKQIKEKTDEIAAFTGLDKYLSLPVRTYSSGMRLRLAFSIATSVSAEILVLDEVVGVGDAAFIEKANQRFKQMITDSSIMVLASHTDDLIEEMCNKVVWLDSGRVAYCGDVKEGLRRYHDSIG